MDGDADPLTGLPRTGTFIAELDARHSPREAPGAFAVALVDIVGLRHINRDYGDKAGDELLREIAARLTDRRFPWVVARVGPDEFAVLSDHAVADSGGQWSRMLRLRVLRNPFALLGRDVTVTFRIVHRAGPAQPGRNLLWELQREALVESTRELGQRAALLERVRAGLGTAIAENSRLRSDLELMRDLANRDYLTGLLNRRGGVNRLAQIAPPFSLALVDLDDLKRLNSLDQLWSAGDRAIVGVADRLRDAFGDAAVARWGGDEYLVLAQHLTVGETVQRLEQVLDACRHELVICECPVTFSAGVTRCLDSDTDRARDRAYRLTKEAKVAKATILRDVP